MRILLNQHLSSGGNGAAASRSTPSVSTKPSAPKEAPAEVLKQEFSDDIGVGDYPRDGREAVKMYEAEQIAPRESSDGKTLNLPSTPKAAPSSDKSQEAGTSVTKSEEQPPAEGAAATSERKAAAPPKAAAAVVEPVSAEPKGRDYTGFNDEEQAVLKKMSNNSFAFAKKIMQENKELKLRGEGTYYQHQQGYTLDPAYQQVQTDSWYADQEGKYWESQLYAMQEGSEWTPLVGYNADGTFKLGEKRQPTTRDVEQVRRAMNDCLSAKQKFAGQQQQFVQQHQQRVQQDNNIIQQEQAKRFSWVADPKHLDNTIDVPGVGEKTIGALKQDFQQLFPTYHRGHVAVDVAANLFAALQIYGARIRELENSNKVSEIKREEVMRGEPKSDTKPQAKGKALHGLTSFDMDDFKV